MLVLTITFWGVVVILLLSPQESLAFGKHDHVSAVDRTTLQIRGGDIISDSNEDNDEGESERRSDVAITTIVDNSFRGGGRQRSKHHRLRDIGSTMNDAYNNYLVKFYWSQVTKGCSLHVPNNTNSSNNPSKTTLQLALRGGADDKNSNKNVVNDFTKSILKIIKNKSLMIVATGIVFYACIPYPANGKGCAASPALCIACGILLADLCTNE